MSLTNIHVKKSKAYFKIYSKLNDIGKLQIFCPWKDFCGCTLFVKIGEFLLFKCFQKIKNNNNNNIVKSIHSLLPLESKINILHTYR